MIHHHLATRLPLIMVVLSIGILYCTMSYSQKPLVRHSADGWSGSLLTYQKDIIHTALELSRPRFGDFELLFQDRQLSTKRVIAEIDKGNIHSGFGTGVLMDYGKVDIKVVQPRHPLFHSLHGLRQCITHNKNLKKFRKIKSLSHFNKITIGQGFGWAEAKIYERYGIKVSSSVSLDRLLSMLNNNRFDCLPLSVLEIDQVYLEAEKKFDDL